MNRQQRQLIIESFRLIRISAEEGERLAREISTQDIGPTEEGRLSAVVGLQSRAERLAEQCAALGKSLASHLGAQAILDRVRYPRAKALSKSEP